MTKSVPLDDADTSRGGVHARALEENARAVRAERRARGRRFRRQTAVHDAKTNANRGRGSVVAIAFLAMAIRTWWPITILPVARGSAHRLQTHPRLLCDRMDAETSVARAARASAGLVLLQLLLYRFPRVEVGPGNPPPLRLLRYDPGLVDAVMIALGDEWARAATLANRHGHIPKDMLTPAVEHLDAATALAADRDRASDWDLVVGTQTRGFSDERDERVANAATRAEASRNGAARLRSLTRTARRREASREVETMRTFDARRFARLGIMLPRRRRRRLSASPRGGGWTVAAAAGVAAMWLGLVGETRRGENERLRKEKRTRRDGTMRNGETACVL